MFRLFYIFVTKAGKVLINPLVLCIMRIGKCTQMRLKDLVGDFLKTGLNVLMSLMQLDIGGAETHVVELAKELKRKGLKPIVTSKGGAYEQELKEAGIKHYCVPLQNKNPINMIKSVHRLKRIIREEKIDIVHSHARIPSFILGQIHRKMKFPFVTTAHWVFTTRWGLKYVTDWGEKTVAVSEDIKTYLMDNYKVPSGDIQVTINGIDTDKFSPDIDKTEILNELGIKDTDTVIVYVSRLDESRSLVAKQLIDTIPEVDKLVDSLKVVVVGDGDDFNNVRSRADKVNKVLGRECIVLTGARTDINRLVAPAHLFIGVSRAALEAMAAQKPVIIAGNEGYIGLFEESKLQVGIDTNFCCRGCADSSSELLLEDIRRFFSLDDEKKRELARYGRELIKREYSVSRMSEDTMRVYKWALEKKDEILISGYYGFKNSGDDALLEAVIKDIKAHKESPNIVVLSANPKETAKKYRVKSINRFNIFAIMKHMKRAGLLVSGGGTLIQDATSTKSLVYYLTVIRLALRNGVKTMLYSNGIGPLKNRVNIERAVKVLNRVDVITLRDPESMRVLKEIGVTEPGTMLSADPVFGIESFSTERGKEILEDYGVDTNKKIIGISVRRTKETDVDFETALAKVCDYIGERYKAEIVFLPMQIAKDEGISRSIMTKMKNPAFIIDKRIDVTEIISVISAMDACIGMRLHSLIYAAIANVPLIGISYDPKIKGFLDYTAQDLYSSISDFTDGVGIELVERLFDNYDDIRHTLESQYELLKEKAQSNGKIAVDLYEKGSVELEK